jgi:hypothetical protein
MSPRRCSRRWRAKLASCIRRITLSGRMTAGRFSKEQARLAAAIGTHSVRINHSTLYKPCVPATK